MNGLLDVARQTYKEATEDVFTLVQEYTSLVTTTSCESLLTSVIDNYNFPFEMKFEISRGFYLRLPVAEIEDRPLDTVFINVVERKKILEFTTLELVKRNAKVP